MDIRRILCGSLVKRWHKKGDFSPVWRFYRAGDSRRAYEAFRKIVKDNPRLIDSGDVLVLQADLELAANHDPEKALSLLDEAMRLGCGYMAYYHLKQGDALSCAGQQQAAMRAYESSVESDHSVFFQSTLARALSRMNDKRALAAWQEILFQDSKNCLAHAYIGWELGKIGDRSGAIESLQKAEVLPSSVWDLMEIAKIYSELSEYKACATICIQAADRRGCGDREKAWLYATASDCYLNLGDARDALQYLERALQLDPEEGLVREVKDRYERQSDGDN